MPELVTRTDTLILTAVLAYLLGSIPFGVLVTRALGLGDLRRIGSGNIGATNVLRTGNKAAALATLLLDGAKGAVAVLLVAVPWSAPRMRRRWRAGGLSGPSFPGLAGLSRRQGRGDLPGPDAGAGLARGAGLPARPGRRAPC
jgi:hypothetical protein